MIKDKVSALMPAYNREDYIEESIDSVLNQSYQNFELVIVDDCSTDGTEEICKRYQKKYPDKIKLLSVGIKKSIGHVRNVCTQNADGEYLAFVDSDDVQFKDKFKTCIDILRNEPDTDIIISRYTCIDCNGNEIHSKNHYPKDLNDSSKLLNIQLRRNYMGTGTCFMRNNKDVVFDDDMNISEDYDLFLSLVYKKYKAKFIDDILTYYRVHFGGTVYSNKLTHEEIQIKILSKYNFNSLYERLREDGITDREIFNTFGLMNINQAKYKDAIECLAKAQNLEAISTQDKIDTSFYSATAYFFCKEYEKCIGCLKETEKYISGDCTVMNNRGMAEYYLGNIIQAEKFFNLAMAQGYLDAERNLNDLKKGITPKYYTSNFLRKDVMTVYRRMNPDAANN